MLASRCVPSAGSSWHQFNSRAGARLVAAAAGLASASAIGVLGAASSSASASASQRRLVVAAGATGGRKGGRALKKGELPTKTCATCGLPFEYRSKWAKVWDEVKYCSERCRRSRGGGGGGGGAAGADA